MWTEVIAMSDFSSIRNAPILAGLSADQLAALAAIARENHVQAGERLFTRGEDAVNFYIVMTGTFSLSLPLRRLDAVIDLGIEEKGPGAALGWSSLVAPYRSVYSCHCIADGTLASVSRDDLVGLMAEDREFATRVASNLNGLIADRLRALQDLWTDEVQQSTARIDYWSHTEIANHLEGAVHPARKPSASGFRLFRRRGGRPSAHH
jgi:CRP-like cAMP-binding protein